MPQSANERRQRKLKTPFLRVPTVDWARVTVGTKREFRMGPYGGIPFPINIPYFPILVVGYAQFPDGRRERLLVLEDSWLEPLRAISDDSLAREGFETRTDFKRYWNRRHRNRRYRPLSKVVVVRVRPLRDGDLEAAGRGLLEHIYAEWVTETDAGSPATEYTKAA